MGTCCAKDPREGQTEIKDIHLGGGELMDERAGPRRGEQATDDSKEDADFKARASTMKSPKPETNVSLPMCDSFVGDSC